MSVGTGSIKRAAQKSNEITKVEEQSKETVQKAVKEPAKTTTKAPAKKTTKKATTTPAKTSSVSTKKPDKETNTEFCHITEELPIHLL